MRACLLAQFRRIVMSIDEAIAKLATDYPEYTITGGDEPLGFWAKASVADWDYERGAITNTETLYDIMNAAITAHV